MSKKLVIISILLVFLLIGALILYATVQKVGENKELSKKVEPVTLTYWRTTDTPGDISDIIADFHRRYSHISVVVKQIKPEEYERALLEAWAEDRGPDIFSIPVTILEKYRSKIFAVPLGASAELGRKYTTGTIKKQTKITIDKIKVPNLRDLRETFIDVVSSGIVQDNKLYGLPLAVDTLVLYYNRDLLNNAGIAHPPLTWQEFVEDVRLLTIQDAKGNFIQSGAALGGVDNVSYLPEILSLLMLQNGTTMITEKNKIGFNLPASDDPSYFPGQEAVRFYLSFSQKGKETYTWNDSMPNDFDAFISGKLAFYFGLASDGERIRQMAPKLNFDSAPVPQIAGSLRSVNLANYYLETVSFKTAHPDEAWGFLLQLLNPEIVKSFLAKTKYPTAHRDLIEWQMQDYELEPFAQSVLTAKCWYKGKDYNIVREALREMIKSIKQGTMSISEALEFYGKKIALTL